MTFHMSQFQLGSRSLYWKCIRSRGKIRQNQFFSEKNAIFSHKIWKENSYTRMTKKTNSNNYINVKYVLAAWESRKMRFKKLCYLFLNATDMRIKPLAKTMKSPKDWIFWSSLWSSVGLSACHRHKPRLTYFHGTVYRNLYTLFYCCRFSSLFRVFSQVGCFSN